MREPQKGGNICVFTANSLHCRAEANTTQWSNYAPIDKRENRNENKNILQVGWGNLGVWKYEVILMGFLEVTKCSVSWSTVPCEPLTWPFPTSPHSGQLWGRGRRKRAECGPAVWLGGLWEAATHSHLHLMIWLTGDPSWQGRRHREYVVCVQAIVCPTESRASIPNKEETNHVLHSHGFQGGINYSLWSSRYTDICCLLSDLIIIILHISLLTLFLMNGEIWVGQVKVLDWSKKKKPPPILKLVYILKLITHYTWM